MAFVAAVFLSYVMSLSCLLNLTVVFFITPVKQEVTHGAFRQGMHAILVSCFYSDSFYTCRLTISLKQTNFKEDLLT